MASHLPTDSARLRSLLHQQQNLISKHPEILQDENARAELLELSRELTAQLTQPDELVADLAHCTGRLMCIRIADDLDLFRLLAEKPRTAQELAQFSGAQYELVLRVMRVLVATGFAAQAGHHRYDATLATRNMTLPSVRAGVRLNFNENSSVCLKTPAYLKENGYRLPQSMTDTPFQYAKSTVLDNHNYWAKQTPNTMADLQTFMGGLYGGPMRSHWLSWFPMKDVLADVKKDETAFVDVAGGRGHEGQAVFKDTGCEGRFVLQDLPEVINAIKDLDPKIERMGHDFMQAQPVKGAKIYFLSNILHDHPDPICQSILRRLADVMTRGYSKLLVSNIIMKDDQPPSRQLDMDITMLVLSGGSQRTEEEWTKLLDPVGFRIVKFWLPPGDQNGIVEAELK